MDTRRLKQMLEEECSTEIDRESLWRLLEVTRQLGAPCDLRTMLGKVIDLALEVLHAERGSVFLYDDQTDELFTFVASEVDEIRLPGNQGIVGHCAQTLESINVRDAYADSRFNPDIDRKTGFRTRCLLSVPLVGIDGDLVGVLQLLNKKGGLFEKDDEQVAKVLAAQCAVALQRTRWMEDYLVRQRQEHDLLIAREIQMDVLPSSMPILEGYELAGWNRPADQAGGDIYDAVSLNENQVLLLLGDASGHGIGPALSVTQVRSMIRVCLRLKAPLDTIVAHVNNQLSEDLADDRFVTAFFGLLDTRTHEVIYQSTGQGPIYFYCANTDDWLRTGPTNIPLGITPSMVLSPPASISFEPGDFLVVISDGIYEHSNSQQERFGEQRSNCLIAKHQDRPLEEIAQLLVKAVDQFAGEAPQEDDMTILLVRRKPRES